MSNISEITEIFDRCIKNTATEAERTFFYDWAELPENRDRAMQLLMDAFSNADRSLDMDSESGEAMVEAILNTNREVSGTLSPRIRFFKTAWFRYAAAIILIVGTGGYLWFRQSRTPAFTNTFTQVATTDIAPGQNGAVLTLGDGTQVVLDSMGNGIIATQNGSKAVLKNGQLAYDPSEKVSGEMTYNTMATPKGRQFNVVLPDGTKVWLNAASSLRYPTAFSGRERRITITGEAYFEVAKDKAKPFFVKINNEAEVEVLGTSFNVNAYQDEENINTTLLEGSVKVIRGRSEEVAILKPGQQAQTANTQRGIKVINNADIEKVMAWKNGAFNFDGVSLVEVMRQLERWYDIEVVYEKGIPDMHFVGKMSRGVSLAGLLRGLKDAEVRFRIEEGRRLVVLP